MLSNVTLMLATNRDDVKYAGAKPKTKHWACIPITDKAHGPGTVIRSRTRDDTTITLHEAPRPSASQPGCVEAMATFRSVKQTYDFLFVWRSDAWVASDAAQRQWSKLKRSNPEKWEARRKAAKDRLSKKTPQKPQTHSIEV